jgi:glyoxalase superfamily protein
VIVTAKFQLVIDCADPEPLARFWVAALGYEFEPPPDGYDDWDDYWRDVGVSEDELGIGLDCIVDPAGKGPRIWFQVVPEKKALKTGCTSTSRVSGGRANPIETRRRLVDAEARRLEALGAAKVRTLYEERLDHYGVAMRDPEGNEFDIS